MPPTRTDFLAMWSLESTRRNAVHLMKTYINELTEEFRFFENNSTLQGLDMRNKYSAAGFSQIEDFSLARINQKIIEKGSSWHEIEKFFNGHDDLQYADFVIIINIFSPLRSADKFWQEIIIDFDTGVNVLIHDVVHDSNATMVADLSSNDTTGLVFGPVVQIRRFGSAGRRTASQIGVHPSQIKFQYSGIIFNKFDINQISIDEYNEKMTQLVHENRANLDKFCLVGVDPEFDLSDQGDETTLKLEVIDYRTLRSFLHAIADKEDTTGNIIDDKSKIRLRVGSIEPKYNTAPNSLCLHYIVRFACGNFLAIHRHQGLDYDRFRISISGEEQFKSTDLCADPENQCQNFVYRALMEEVFPASGEAIDGISGKKITSWVDFSRIISLMYEERYCNFAMTALIQLNITIGQYILYYRSFLQQCGKIDYEGNRYYFSQNDLENLFVLGKMELRPFQNEGDIITVQACCGRNSPFSTGLQLHSSSLYRANELRHLLFD